MNTPDVDALPIENVVRRICALNEGIRDFWSASDGWAYGRASSLLERSRLDWQVSLSHCLKLWITPPYPDLMREGSIILGWANLGALVEGTLKWFLSVYREDYPDDGSGVVRRGKPIEPDAAMLDELRRFFASHVWVEEECRAWDAWLGEIRDRRNAVHAYQDRDIGDASDLHGAIRRYLELVRALESRVPYPDGVYGAIECADDL